MWNTGYFPLVVCKSSTVEMWNTGYFPLVLCKSSTIEMWNAENRTSHGWKFFLQIGTTMAIMKVSSSFNRSVAFFLSFFLSFG
ncbi:hypothetical protein L6452_07233 [Arctium lappa]|uniref:Uncharacterized protein n=1 Tax=Arctium lappa TaxID=4217 RepID=A0ACB9EL69_ARCLA|nr:hypothetical protein L6452_07233 [Arctium lappa]